MSRHRLDKVIIVKTWAPPPLNDARFWPSGGLVTVIGEDGSKQDVFNPPWPIPIGEMMYLKKHRRADDTEWYSVWEGDDEQAEAGEIRGGGHSTRR